MRFLLILAAGIVLFLGTSSVPAQKVNKEDKKPAADTQIQVLGGKTLEQWIKEIKSPDRSRGENAIRTIQGFGPDRAYEAVPALIAELKKQTHGKIRLDVSISVNAVMALGTILGNAEKPDPETVKEAVEVIMRMLADSQLIVNYRAAEALGKIGPRSKPAIPKLLILLHDKYTWETRQAAATALGFIAMDREGKKGPPAEVVKGLYGALSDPSSRVRLAAIQSMTYVGTPANVSEKERDTFVGYLKPKAENAKEDPTVRIWARMAIMSISHEITSEHMKAITDMLKNPELTARIEAARTLTICGESVFSDQDHKLKGNPQNVLKGTIPALMGALNDKEPIVVFNCMMALTKMGKEGSRAIPMLQRIANDKERPDDLRQLATQAVAFLKSTATQVAPAVAPKEIPRNKAVQK
jgi:HEAT repeat protein